MRSLIVILLGAAVGACTSVKPCSTNAECATGQTCIQKACRGVNSLDGGVNSGGGTGGGQGGGGGGGMLPTGCSPSAAGNDTKDTDCDGLSDAEEYATEYTGALKTNPCNPDTDGDGLTDGVEVGRITSVGSNCTQFVSDNDPRSKSVPTAADSDGDGLSDGAEDKNHNGKLDTGETNPVRPDSDCDGYSDKEELDGAPGCVTDPTLKDSDADGLFDGVESGLIGPGADPVNCQYKSSVFDFDPSSKTSACTADSDGDGVLDGAEDANLDGQLNPGELDPRDGGDSSIPPVTQACSTANLKPITLYSSGVSDVQIALPTDFTEHTALALNSVERGYIFYDPGTQVAGFAISKLPTGADGSGEEGAERSKLGAVSNPLIQTFTTWDGFANSVRATYDLPGTADLKAAINTIATNFVGANVTGTLTGMAGVVGPFKVQAEFVRRSANRSVVVVAIVPAAMYSGQSLFRLDDAANGTPLAQFGDFTGTQCEVFDATINQKADFLWVVDDSGSMRSSQSAVATAGNLFGAKLASAGLDWRVGGVSTGFYPSAWDGHFFDWTTDIGTMNGWFSSGFGTRGSSSEQGFRAAKVYVNLESDNSNTPKPFRTDAAIHFIFLTDTRDQDGSTTVSDMRALLASKYPGQTFMSHGIVCPEGGSCGDETELNPGKYHTLIRQTGGVLGNIMTFKPATPTNAEKAQQAALIDAILGAAIGGTGHQLQRPPISATIKVAVASTRGNCATSDVPRSRTNGWDIDSATRRMVFYGDCIPSAAGVKVAVSYKYWNDNSTDVDGDACGAMCMAPEVCDPSTKTCVCAADCGGCSTGLVCNTTTCTCDPIIN